MATTHFVDAVTMVPAAWANDVNTLTYNIFGGAQTLTAVKTVLGMGSMSGQSASNIAITGGTLDGVAIGYGTGAVNAKFQSAYSYATPSDPNHVANKAYVDAQIALAGMNPNYLRNNYLALAGGTLTGPLLLAADPVSPAQAATKHYVDAVAQGYVTQSSLNSTVATLASLTYVNALASVQANRLMYHDSLTGNGAINQFPLRVTPAGDVMAWVAGVPVPSTQITVNAASLKVTFSFNPVGAVELMYFGATGTGPALEGVLLTTGGTMTGPLTMGGLANPQIVFTSSSGPSMTIGVNGASKAITFYDAVGASTLASLSAVVNGGKFISNYGIAVNSSGTAPTIGTATLSGGVVTVNTTGITSSSRVFVTLNSPSGTVGQPYVKPSDIVAGISFTIRSTSASDNSNVNWVIIDSV